ncbi:AI-2E family transporter [Rubrolithibacter danxiaensis]|uniref:AI-2E family transporter n=1 Tax=Rubrolithibacter danxiaensis TaxID=3390805 RepID=UPI003BF831EE
MKTTALYKATHIVLLLVLVTAALYFTRSVLIPLTFAAILAMLLMPLSKKLESKGVNCALSALISILVLLLSFALIGAVLSWQLSDFTKDLSGIEQKATDFLKQIQEYINSRFGIAPQKQQEILKQQSEQGGSSAKLIANITSTFVNLAVNIILVLVYIFLFLYFRGHLKKFLLKVSPVTQRENINRITSEASKVSQQYLTGLAMMIGTLWILYSIGFSIIGVKYAIFFAVLCGLLEIIPFIGNLTGTTLTIVMSLVQGGDVKMAIGILVTYGLIQFIQTYILEPVIVGNEVNINPVFTIVGIVAGEALWGIAGMVLAIPMLGIAKIVCDHFEPLKPYGFLLGQEKHKKKTRSWQNIKDFFSSKRKR